jgi:hypothetical protein
MNSRPWDSNRSLIHAIRDMPARTLDGSGSLAITADLISRRNPPREKQETVMTQHFGQWSKRASQPERMQILPDPVTPLITAESTSPSFQSAMRMIGMERKTDLMEFQLRHVMRPTWCDVPTIPGFSLSRRKGCLRLAVTLLILGVLGIACLFCLSGCRSGPPPMF